jgi:hypothetical protein
VVTNPPYGERMLSAATANEGIGSLMGELHDSGWGLFALSGDASFEEEVGRMRSQVFGRGRERESGQCMRGERERKRERASERERARETKREGGRKEGRARALYVCVIRLIRPLHAVWLCRCEDTCARLTANNNSPAMHACSHEYSAKRRKLYNGKIPCQLFQYFGEVPRERRRNPGVCGVCVCARVVCAFVSS